MKELLLEFDDSFKDRYGEEMEPNLHDMTRQEYIDYMISLGGVYMEIQNGKVINLIKSNTEK
jgi:hypothetical protein